MFLRSTLLKCPRIVFNNTIRTCSHQIKPPQTQAESPSDWKIIYELPSIRMLGGLNRLKIFQSAFTAVGVPVLMGLEMFQIVPSEAIELFAVIGITGTISLCIYSYFSAKTVGFVYVNPAVKKIRFAYIDFWGKRINQDLTLDEILSCDEKRIFDSYRVIKTSTSAGSLKLLRFGNITDPDVFFMTFENK